MTDPTQPEPIDDGGEHPVVPWLNERRRAWLYRVLVAAVPLLVVLGVITETTALPALALMLALVGTGTAAANTSTSKGA